MKKVYIIGTGINVNIAEEDFPEDLRDKATSLSQLKGEEIPRVAFFRAVLEHMDALYDSILREGFAEVFSWRRQCWLGRLLLRRIFPVVECGALHPLEWCWG